MDKRGEGRREGIKKEGRYKEKCNKNRSVAIATSCAS